MTLSESIHETTQDEKDFLASTEKSIFCVTDNLQQKIEVLQKIIRDLGLPLPKKWISDRVMMINKISASIRILNANLDLLLFFVFSSSPKCEQP